MAFVALNDLNNYFCIFVTRGDDLKDNDVFLKTIRDNIKEMCKNKQLLKKGKGVKFTDEFAAYIKIVSPERL